MRHIVLGTAGHIDHGKTTLVGALTGTNTDRLKEEKRRGISIELGFAPWPLTDALHASIVDVPGHEKLVRTMVAGAGGIDIGLLIVAADDGVMPQTQEHLDVLRLLGIPAGIIVLTKADLVDEELIDLVKEEITEVAAGTVFADSPVVAVSSTTGLGLDALKEAVLEKAKAVVPRFCDGPAFLPLDRIFTKAGYGTVGTGTLLRGALRVGDTVEALGPDLTPVGELKVRGLQALGEDQEQTLAGMRTAVNLAGKVTQSVKRGMVIASPGAFVATQEIIVWVDVLGQANPLKEETLTLHLGTTERDAHVIPLGDTQIASGASGGALLRLNQPVAAFAGQRLVLRRPGIFGQATVAGGEILDPEPPIGKGAVSLAASQLTLLKGTAKERLGALARESRAKGVSHTTILRRLPPGEGGRAAEFLEKKGHLVRLGAGIHHWVDTQLVDGLVSQVVKRVGEFHNDNPMGPGMVEAEVHSQLPPPERHLAQLVADRAVKLGKLVRDGTVLAIPGRGAAVDPESKKLMDEVVTQLENAGLMPPTDDAIAKALGLNTKRFNQILGFLRRSGSIAKVADGQHYDCKTLAQAEERIVAAFDGKPELTASELKAILGGISRKWAIPLFEHMDKTRVTVRAGNIRRLHPARKKTAS